MRFLDLLLAEGRILIDVYFCINAVDVLVRGDGPRVDFDLSRININEHLVNLLKLLDSLVEGLSLETQICADLASVCL